MPILEKKSGFVRKVLVLDWTHQWDKQSVENLKKKSLAVHRILCTWRLTLTKVFWVDLRALFSFIYPTNTVTLLWKENKADNFMVTFIVSTCCMASNYGGYWYGKLMPQVLSHEEQPNKRKYNEQREHTHWISKRNIQLVSLLPTALFVTVVSEWGRSNFFLNYISAAWKCFLAFNTMLVLFHKFSKQNNIC